MGSNKLRPAVMAAFIFLSGCELADAIEVAVSGPDCGNFGKPAELGYEDMNVLAHYFDWDRIDGMLAVLEPYEGGHGPDILFALGILHLRKASTLSHDRAYYRRGVRLIRWASLCGQAPAVSYLSEFYIAGPPIIVDKDPKLSDCLEEAYEADRSVRAVLAGRVWRCGVRVEDVLE